MYRDKFTDMMVGVGLTYEGKHAKTSAHAAQTESAHRVRQPHKYMQT